MSIMFWIERLIINSAEELSFRGTQFQPPILSSFPKSFKEWGNDHSGYFLLKWAVVLP